MGHLPEKSMPRGHRDALLQGAKLCLLEKGYKRTTTRDIVAASGTNLASIGYHFGSKEELLNQALVESIMDWSGEFERVLAAGAGSATTSIERFEATWTRIVEQFANYRQLWISSFEIFAQAQHVPSVGQAIAAGLRQTRAGLARMFLDIAEEDANETSDLVGSFYQALVVGVLVQWLINPQDAPTGHDLTRALQSMLAWPRSSDVTN